MYGPNKNYPWKKSNYWGNAVQLTLIPHSYCAHGKSRRQSQKRRGQPQTPQTKNLPLSGPENWVNLKTWTLQADATNADNSDFWYVTSGLQY